MNKMIRSIFTPQRLIDAIYNDDTETLTSFASAILIRYKKSKAYKTIDHEDYIELKFQTIQEFLKLYTRYKDVPLEKQNSPYAYMNIVVRSCWAKYYHPHLKKERIEPLPLTITLSRKDVRLLLNCLIRPNPKGEDLDFQLAFEDQLAEYLNLPKDKK